ncbi:MAG: TM2 domain-containing protein [Acidobacteriota bacterium]|nr:TM2 domain-containing protein [Blastocatellia bacterium]MDW8413237.1 TM2 domain-containing protein [Acidobacteriota bacterium]
MQQDEPKDWAKTLQLCVYLGGFGAHRFYTGHHLIAILQLITLGGCFIWAIIDMIKIINGTYRDAQGRPLQKRN